MDRFEDRRQAGRVLARKLGHHANTGAVVLALPRGGVPVAYEVARALGLPLDIYVVRKIGVPGHEELAMGAVASGGTLVLNEDVVGMLRISTEAIARVAEREIREIARREHAYRGDRPLPDVRDKVVIIVDDGLATGSTMRAAIGALRQAGARRIVVAAPVAARETCAELGKHVDEIVCALAPERFYAVGAWYEDFGQTSDEEVRALLAAARSASPSAEAAQLAPGRAPQH